jgi:hypothetical protein
VTTALAAGRAVADQGNDNGNGNQGNNHGNGNGNQGNGNGNGNGGSGGGAQQQPYQPAPTAGSYNVKMVGSWSGVGDSLVTTTAVSFSVPVTDSSGNAGNFIASNLTITGDHFSGSGTVNGVNVTVAGRLDQVSNARLFATIVSADGRVSRIIGISSGAAGQGDPFAPGN